jgi:hypothetical protein
LDKGSLCKADEERDRVSGEVVVVRIVMKRMEMKFIENEFQQGKIVHPEVILQI